MKINNEPIIVIGMHRSGTSALSGELANLGVFMGRSLYKAQKDVNEKGFFENRRLVELNEDLQNSLTSSWDDPLVLFKQSQKPADHFFTRATEFVQSDYDGSKLWGMKDPRVSVLMPFWNEVFEQLDIKPNYLFMIRNPFEVAQSLKRRDRFSIEKGLMIWLNYNFAASRGSLNHRALVISFEELLTSPELIRNRIADAFEINLFDARVSFIEKDLQTQRVETHEGAELSLLGSLSLNLYNAIVSQNEDDIVKLERQYMEYCSQLDTVLIEHLNAVQASEIKFRTIFEDAYNTVTWKLMWPLRKFENYIRTKVKFRD